MEIHTIGGIMRSCTVAELARGASAICSDRESVVVTNNGRPQNVIINISDLDFDDAVDIAREARAASALARMRRSSVASGLDDITDEEIDAEVAAVRAAR